VRHGELPAVVKTAKRRRRSLVERPTVFSRRRCRRPVRQRRKCFVGDVDFRRRVFVDGRRVHVLQLGQVDLASML